MARSRRSTWRRTPPVPAIPVGPGPSGIAITPDGGTAYVVNGQTPGTVTPIHTADNSTGAAISVGDSPVAIAITPDGKTAYVTNSDSHDVTPIDTASNTARTPISVPERPYGIAITPDGTTAYVVGVSGVTPIDLLTNTAGPPVPLWRQFPADRRRHDHPRREDRLRRRPPTVRHWPDDADRHRHEHRRCRDHGRPPVLDRDHAQPNADGRVHRRLGDPRAGNQLRCLRLLGQRRHRRQVPVELRRRPERIDELPDDHAHIRHARRLHGDADRHRRRRLLDHTDLHRTDDVLPGPRIRADPPAGRVLSAGEHLGSADHRGQRSRARAERLDRQLGRRHTRLQLSVDARRRADPRRDHRVLHRPARRSGSLADRHRDRVRWRRASTSATAAAVFIAIIRPASCPPPTGQLKAGHPRPDHARPHPDTRSPDAATIRRPQLPHRQLLPLGGLGDPRRLRLRQAPRRTLRHQSSRNSTARSCSR